MLYMYRYLTYIVIATYVSKYIVCKLPIFLPGTVNPFCACMVDTTSRTIISVLFFFSSVPDVTWQKHPVTLLYRRLDIFFFKMSTPDVSAA